MNQASSRHTVIERVHDSREIAREGVVGRVRLACNASKLSSAKREMRQRSIVWRLRLGLIRGIKLT